MKYRKRPLIVEANRWFPQAAPTPETEDTPGKPRRPELYGVRYCPPTHVDATASRGITFSRPSRYVIDTLEGVMDVQPGDWIVTGVKGERYAVKPDIFELTYEPASIPGYTRQRNLLSMVYAVAIVIGGGILGLLLVWALK